MVSDHPLLGVGAGNFSVVEPFYTVRAINLPRVDLVSEGELAQLVSAGSRRAGIVGLVAFLGVIASTLVVGVAPFEPSSATATSRASGFARAVVIGTTAMLVAYFFATNHYEKQLWLMLGTCVALSSVARSSLVAGRRRGRPRVSRRRLDRPIPAQGLPSCRLKSLAARSTKSGSRSRLATYAKPPSEVVLPQGAFQTQLP